MGLPVEWCIGRNHGSGARRPNRLLGLKPEGVWPGNRIPRALLGRYNVAKRRANRSTSVSRSRLGARYMPEAFDWLDENMEASLLAPDEAMDWIWMINDEDHALLMDAWNRRPREWREALAYVVGQGDAKYALPILKRALYDEAPDVALQAVVSMHDLVFEHGTSFTLRQPEVAQLKRLHATPVGSNCCEVSELIGRLELEQGGCT